MWSVRPRLLLSRPPGRPGRAPHPSQRRRQRDARGCPNDSFAERAAEDAPAVGLHPVDERFRSVADAYEHGRPEYAPAVVGALCAELRLAPGAPVLDLAAGTGKLSLAQL